MTWENIHDILLRQQYDTISEKCRDKYMPRKRKEEKNMQC